MADLITELRSTAPFSVEGGLLTRAADALEAAEGFGPLQPPTEAGMVRYSVEVIPHDWPNDGLAWETGTQSPADVARALRGVADQVEYFTPPLGVIS